jgi:alkylhydroperoxidase family enzyme
MAHVPLLAPEDWPAGSEELLERIRGARRGNVINIYRMLIHSPKMVPAWLDWFNTVRWGMSLPGRLRELVIVRIANITGSAYAIRQHVPKLAAADGVSQEECDALADSGDSPTFSDAERAALAYAETMIRDRKVGDEVMARLKQHYSDTEIVELTILVGTYAMHGHVMQALDIDLEVNPS